MSDNIGTPGFSIEERERLSLCEALDRILHKGAVVAGEVTISVADIDLIYLGLQLVLTSVDNAEKWNRQPREKRYGT